MDGLFSFQLILLASRAQQQSSTRAGKLGVGADCTFDLLWITLHPSSEAKPLGSDRAPWKTRPVSLEPFLLGVQHCKYSISMPNISDSLLHANPIVSTTRAKGSAKRKCNNPSCVGVLFSLDAPLISRLRWVWLFPEKTTIYAVTRWLARQVGQRETCSKAWKNGTFSDRTGSRADLQESFNLRGAFWVDGKFRNFLDPTQTCSKLGAWDLWPYWGIHEENTADLWGEWDPGIQGRWGEFSLASWTCSCKPCFLDLSFGVAPVCCHSEKTHMFFVVLPHDGPKRPITSWPSNRIAWFWVSFQCHRTLCKSTFSLKLSNWTKNQPIALSCYDSVCPSAKGAVSGNLVG